ncbi:rod-binding protein [Fuerstiella marisgermanici]|uniref:Peptidoglycan hydrolase FlgJ n=1 Tax=Fuerstiella marisgermanici TaxID=1891926 RepID=A0A1P8WA42_9PLAN|nr:rod-binding protein [Fuerstiella marisgermanici]APZ90933.1 Peptidoglycan hydrolase FlgJ [Fuerstiella marisgermanici]
MQATTSVPTTVDAQSPFSQFSEANRADDKAAKVAKEFEALFVSMMLKSMRQSMSEDMFAGDKSDTFGGMFDSFMGEHIAESGGIGMAKMIQSTGISGGDLTRALSEIQQAADQAEAGQRSSGNTQQIKAYQNALTIGQ